MAAIVSSSNSHHSVYYQRPLDKANASFAEMELIKDIAYTTLTLACVIRDNQFPNSTQKLTFHINQALLHKILEHIEEVPSKYQIKPETRHHVRQCLSAYKKPLPSYSSPFLTEANYKIVRDLITSLFMQYRHMKKFQEIPLTPPYETQFSCFDYVVFKLGLEQKFLIYTLFTKKPKNEQESHQQHIDFYITLGYRYDSPPFQPNDIVITYSETKESKHLALVDKDGRHVFAKLGNETPLAHYHEFDETLLEHGVLFRILRKS